MLHYKCPTCGFTRQIPFNCKSRLCSNCRVYIHELYG
ncbi:MAG: transposase zinc-binding domain-containing protein [Candidatus Helarchaeota archaeon]